MDSGNLSSRIASATIARAASVAARDGSNSSGPAITAGGPAIAASLINSLARSRPAAAGLAGENAANFGFKPVVVTSTIRALGVSSW